MMRPLDLTHGQRGLTPALVLVGVALAISGCGECVFEETVSGEVRDGRGGPVEGALITSCRASGWCGSATTTTCQRRKRTAKEPSPSRWSSAGRVRSSVGSDPSRSSEPAVAL